MLLFGVGAAASANNSNTTLGRIGLGYLYTDFQPQISWTLPGYDALNGNFGAKIGIFDPNTIAADTAAYNASDKHAPRVEAQITYTGGIGDLGINLWVDGSYQNTERTDAEAAQYTNHYGALNGAASATAYGDDSDVDSAGVGFGTKLSYQGFSLVASGFYGTAMGIRGQHSTQAGAAANGALDDQGNVRHSYGGYLQGTYDFGQGTSAGYSYGGNCLTRTNRDLYLYAPTDGSNATGIMNCQTMHSGMIWHNVTDNFRLVAEGGYTEKTWYLALEEQEDSFGGVGAFFFW